MLFFKKYKFILFTILTISAGHFCKNPIEQKCELTCHFAEKCALEAQKAAFVEPKMLERIHIQCLGSCTMFQQEFLSCKEQSKDSCRDFYNCILSSGVFN